MRSKNIWIFKMPGNNQNILIIIINNFVNIQLYFWKEQLVCHQICKKKKDKECIPDICSKDTRWITFSFNNEKTSYKSIRKTTGVLIDHGSIIRMNCLSSFKNAKESDKHIRNNPIATVGLQINPQKLRDSIFLKNNNTWITKMLLSTSIPSSMAWYILSSKWTLRPAEAPQLLCPHSPLTRCVCGWETTCKSSLV